METESVELRTIEEVNKVIELAKLSKADLLPTSQAIYFSSDPNEHNFKFLELDKHLLNSLSVGKTLRIVGSDDENVVICTEDRTYNVVETETSNSLLLTENLKFFSELKENAEEQISVAKVSGIFYDYLEVNPAKAHLHKLMEILEKSVYKGPELEQELNDSVLVSYEDIVNNIQASEQELKDALAKLHVATVNGKIRLLEFEYHFRVLSYMLKLLEENSWSLDEIDYEETVSSLRDFVPLPIINSLFDLYTEESRIVDGQQLYRYKEEDICKFFAKVLLINAEKFHLEEFLQVWQESVPEGMNVSEDMLHGIAIVDRKSNPPAVKYYPENKLPDNLFERFAVLFSVKEKWTFSEIKPYIEPLTNEKLDVNALLAKYTRVSHLQGSKCYTAKHCK